MADGEQRLCHLPSAIRHLFMTKIIAWIDGAARGNPGPAGYRGHMKKTGEIIEASGFLGRTTNNVAEYAGLIDALTVAVSEGAREVEIISDSELLVKQMRSEERRVGKECRSR